MNNKLFTKQNIRLIFTGFSMGVADLVPGVSGGTIAFLYGIYDELLYSIKIVTGEFPRYLLKLQFSEAFKKIPLNFLLPLFIGIFSAIFGLVHIFSHLLEVYPGYLWSTFFGLVLGSVFVVSKRIKKWNINRLLLVIGGFLITYFMVGLPVLNAQPTNIVIFATGAIASVAMILPGISGSLIMVILGQYENVISSVADRNLTTLIIFATGAVIGLGLFSRLISWLLRVHHSATIGFLIGVMLGSLRKVWPWQNEMSSGVTLNYFPALEVNVLFAVLLGLSGFMLVYYLEKIGIAKEHKDITDKEFISELKEQHD